MDMTDFRKLPSKCRQLSSMLSYIWYILYQLWYILHISFDTWGYPWYIPCIWHLKIHIPCIWHAYLIDMTFHKKIIEHICVISIGYTRMKILILYIYLVYPTPRGSPSRLINQPRSLRQRLWPHHEGADTIQIQQRRKRAFLTLQLTVHLLCIRVSVCNTTAIDDNAIAAASSVGAVN